MKNVLHVQGPTKNLLVASTMENKGYEVYFRDRHVLVKPRASSPNLGHDEAERVTSTC